MTPKHFGEICATLGSITRRSARLRDKGDLLARNLTSLAESEKINSSMHNNVLKFAENYAAVQDYCHAKVQRLESKVVKPLTKYGEKCRYVKRGIKSEITACGKEKKVVQKLEKLQGKSDNESQIAELELQKVQGEEEVVGEAMEVEVDKFERDKLMDVKNMLTELVKVEMLYHAKALEYLSLCYENTQSIDVDADIDEYKRTVAKMSKSTPRDNNARSQRMDASTLTTTGVSRRSSDTYASGTLSSTFSSTGHSRQSQLSQSLQRRGSHNFKPSPRAREPSPRVREPSPRVREPSPRVREPSPRVREPSPRICEPSPCVRQSADFQPSPRVRISSPMYQDDDDDEDEDSDEDYYDD
ncbi:hypothetical protein ACOMHN_032251 [Nucella lapillus]